MVGSRVIGVAILVAATGCLGIANGSADTGGADTASTEPSGVVVMMHPIVLATLAHDSSAYTEGLELAGSSLYESTGIAGQSELRELDPATGAVRRSTPLPSNFYGEGLTVSDDRLWQLTFRDGVAIEWDTASLRPLRQVPFTGEGWGLCRSGDRFVRSDGTDRLHFHDLTDFTEIGSVSVVAAGKPLAGLNELECVDGQVWANASPSDELVRIDPATGTVTAAVDARGMMPGPRTNAQVLNGIAHVSDNEFLLTAKNWPLMYRVRFESD